MAPAAAALGPPPELPSAESPSPVSPPLEPPPDSPPSHAALENPPTISAEELHELLLASHTAGNLARKRFIDCLRSLYESRLYTKLGHPSIYAYSERTFRYQRSQTLDFIRVSRKLLELPALARAFELGELSWSLLSELTRVAKESTEAKWLDFARRRSVREVLLEVKDAVQKGRDEPDPDRYGLPGLPVRLTFELPPAEHAMVEATLARVAVEMGGSLDGERPPPEKVLLYLAHRVLATDPEGLVTGERTEREESPFQVVFFRCLDCRRAAVQTPDGRVEVPAEAVERVEGGAERVVIPPEEEVPPAASAAAEAGADAKGAAPTLPPEERDRPNTPALRRKLRARAGNRCENPMCRREIGSCGQGHHVVARSKGGCTALWNEVYVCRLCRIRHNRHYADSRIMPSRWSSTRWAKHSDRPHAA